MSFCLKYNLLFNMFVAGLRLTSWMDWRGVGGGRRC